MTSFLLKLLGVHTDATTRVADAGVGLRNPGAVGWVLLALLVLAAAVFWSYRREAAHLSRGRRWGMAGLRAMFLLLLLALLLQPVLSFTTEGSVRRVMVQLVDATGSMRIADPRTDDPDVKRAALGRGLIEPAKGLGQSFDAAAAASLRSVPRIDLVKATLTNAKLKLLPRLAREYDLRPQQFGQGVSELATTAPDTVAAGDDAAVAWVGRLSADAPATALGDAVRETILKSRGQPLAGVFLVTDGQSNAGSQALAAAEVARQENVPLYVWGVGISSPKDVVVANLFSQDVAFLNDQVPVVARVRGA
ncbi:MAG TPA: hypothetical protein VK324_01505, partial [Tepidisphaeraceae bacterium]|nr:hypothetical protein [Tepidisphaeraceae bacterium]